MSFVRATDDAFTRLLVCEGPCNPDIRDYDEARSRIPLQGSVSRRDFNIRAATTTEWSRRLKHTAHIPETETPIFHNGEWCRAWVCSECGHRRYL